jgi:CHRD domain
VLVGQASADGADFRSCRDSGVAWARRLGKRERRELRHAAVGEVNESRAQGNATFQLNADGTELSYRLSVANIANVFQAHIHQGAVGSNGPIVVWLYPSTTPGAGPLGGGRIDGVIATGTITAANLVGPLVGMPLSALVTQLTSGNTYVNVHTNDGVAPTNTGPGDFPGGEIRGQTEHRGH